MMQIVRAIFNKLTIKIKKMTSEIHDFDQNTTLNYIAAAHHNLLKRFVKSDETICEAKEIKDSALKGTQCFINRLFEKIAVLHPEIQGEVALTMQKIVAITYLTAVAEAIDEKQSYVGTKTA